MRKNKGWKRCIYLDNLVYAPKYGNCDTLTAYRTIVTGWTIHMPVRWIMVNVSYLPYFGAYAQLCKSGGEQKGVNTNSKRAQLAKKVVLL